MTYCAPHPSAERVVFYLFSEGIIIIKDITVVVVVVVVLADDCAHKNTHSYNTQYICTMCVYNARDNH